MAEDTEDKSRPTPIVHATGSEEILDQIFSEAPSFMTVLSVPGYRYLKSNEAHFRLIQKWDVIGKTVQEVVPEVEAQGFIDILDEVVRTGRAYIATELPITYLGNGGTRTEYMDLVYKPMRRSNGDIYAIAAHGSIVTEKVITRKSVENERANFRNLFKQTPEMVCILSGKDHVFEFVNEAHIKALGFDATGRTVRDAQPESVEVHGILDEVYRTGKTAELLEIAVTVTDRVRYFNLTYAARRDDLASINGVMILGVEVTEQVINREQLKKAVRSRDDFMSICSHELKTPLTSMKLQAQIMRKAIDKGDDSAYAKRRVDMFADQSEKQIGRLTRLVDDMLDIARIRSGSVVLKRERFDLCELVKESIDRMQAQFQEAGCGGPKLTFCEPAIGHWDRLRVEQILNNLFTNAIKYGRGKPVDVMVECFDQSVKLTVTDQGIGIPQEAQAKVFDRFERAVDANEVSGLGLGLFICRQIAHAHGGKIWVESKVNEGSAFFVELPITDQESVKASAHGW